MKNILLLFAALAVFASCSKDKDDSLTKHDFVNRDYLMDCEVENYEGVEYFKGRLNVHFSPFTNGDYSQITFGDLFSISARFLNQVIYEPEELLEWRFGALSLRGESWYKREYGVIDGKATIRCDCKEVK